MLIDGKLRSSRLTIVDAKCRGAKTVVRGLLMYGEDLLIVNAFFSRIRTLLQRSAMTTFCLFEIDVFSDKLTLTLAYISCPDALALRSVNKGNKATATTYNETMENFQHSLMNRTETRHRAIPF